MEQRIFDILFEINQEGFDNSKWGMMDNIVSKPVSELFGEPFEGKDQDIEAGKWLYIWVSVEDTFCFIKTDTCDRGVMVKGISNYPEVIFLWKIEGYDKA